MLQKGRAAWDEAGCRWAAKLLNHLVFAEPGKASTTSLLTATCGRLGGPSESGPPRDVYLSAAYGLRHGPPERGPNVAAMKDLMLSNEIELTGSQLDLLKFFSLFDKPNGRLPIVTP